MEHGRSGGSGHEAALRAVQRPAAKPWRGGGSAGAMAAPAPPKVYRVAPRDFRELVQRLTGAAAAAPAAMGARGPAAVPAPPQPYMAPAPAHGDGDASPAEMFDYASWFSVPLLSPASMPASGYDGHLHGNGAFL
ncbi:uncharacterized protein LOC121053829 [Oryza brachyantha]|uniref:uncharacterized protein LOC121053829 n=1 Tax=Oryza brachyantha TaxID=4533 RepID=UPI001ADCA53F|nr:uncharacterized protein LOC121053829 [Oryza brachyantha]